MFRPALTKYSLTYEKRGDIYNFIEQYLEGKNNLENY